MREIKNLLFKMKIMKKNRRLLLLFALICFLFQSNAYSQLICEANIVGALSSTADGSTLKLYAQSVVENSDIPDLQISKDNVIFSDFLTYDCDDIGANIVYAKGTVNGVVQNCFANLLVEDKLKPVPYAHNNTTVSLNGGNSVTVLASTVDAGSFDNCGIESMTLEPSTFTANGTYLSTLTVTDPSGNSDFANVFITVVGGSPACNESLNISLDIVGEATAPAILFIEGNADYDVLEVSLDNINFGETVTFTCDHVGVLQTVYVHIEQDGNDYSCSTEVMIDDKLAPVVVVSDFTIDLDSDSDTYTLVVDDINNGSFDNCGDFELSLSQTEFSSDDWGQNQVVLTGTDVAGLTSSATSTVTVLINGETPPLQCVSLSTAIVSPWGGPELWAVDFVINDENFDQVLASLDPAGPFTESFIAPCGLNDADPHTVYIKAFAGAEEYECDVELTVIDNVGPVAIVEVSVILTLENGTATLTPEMVDEGSYDHCTDVTLSLSQTIFTAADIGTNFVTLTVTDLNGNSNVAVTAVIVDDGSGCNLAFVQMPDNLDIFDDNGTVDNLSIENLQDIYGYTFEEVHPYTANECEGIVYTYADEVINFNYGYKVLRTWTALDWFTTDIITHVQILKLYTSYASSLACNDLVSVSVQNGPVTIWPSDILEGGPYNYDNMVVTITDADDNVVEDNLITAEYLGQTLLTEVTDITNGNTCWGNIEVDNTDEYCELDGDDITYPLANIYLPEFNLDPQNLSPQDLMNDYGYEMTEVLMTWPDEDCTLVGITFEDDVFDYGDGSFKIVRTLTVVDWIAYDPSNQNEGIWTFVQVINAGIDQYSLICDFLPRTADPGDCESGHTYDDDVEWPADLEIADYRISPAELVEYSMVDVLDSEPSFYNSPDDYEASNVDILVEINASSLVLGRVWTVTHIVYGFTWTYNQTIVIDFSDFEDLVTINTGTNRAMPGVMINETFMTDAQGDAYVEGQAVNSIEYEDEFLNGINVLDLILIQRHILGLTPLPDFGRLAADINNDSSIKASDLTELRKKLTGKIPTGKGVWRFYTKELEGPLTVEPKGVYMGIKAGDVDDSALLQGEENPTPDSKLELLDILLNKGENYSIPVFLNDEFDALALHFFAEINTELIEVVEITSDHAQNELDYHITEEGILSFIFSNATDGFLLGGDSSDPVFTIHIEAKENSLLGLAMDFENRLSYIASSDLELIILGGEIGDMIGTGTNSEELSRLTVYPNPTSEYLNLDLKNVNVDGTLEVSVFELNGQKLFTRPNEQKINVSDLKTGMYYYQVKIGAYTTTGKFLVVN